MVTPLVPRNRRHTILLTGYEGPPGPANIVILEAWVGDKLVDQAVADGTSATPKTVYLVVEYGRAVHSEKRGVLMDYLGAPDTDRTGEIGNHTIRIVEASDRNTVLHTVRYRYGAITTFAKA